jgi:hypothetical protein
MTTRSTYELRIQELLDFIDSKIEVLKSDMEGVPGQESQRYQDAISFLITNREAMKRGLLTPGQAFGQEGESD